MHHQKKFFDFSDAAGERVLPKKLIFEPILLRVVNVSAELRKICICVARSLIFSMDLHQTYRLEFPKMEKYSCADLPQLY